MTERQEQLLALHEEEKRRRATQELSPSTLKAHNNIEDGLKTKTAAAYGSMNTPSKNRHARSSSLPVFALIQGSGDGHDVSNGSYKSKSPSSVHSTSRAGPATGGDGQAARPVAPAAIPEGDGEESF